MSSGIRLLVLTFDFIYNLRLSDANFSMLELKHYYPKHNIRHLPKIQPYHV